MRIRCPHCHHAVEIVDDSSFREVECPSCGSHFDLIGDATTETCRSEARTIGHFQLIERLGVGAFGMVWKAKDTDLDRVIALKIPRKEQLTAQETELFLRDARAAAQLRHANIVSIHEVGKDGDTIYIAMDYVEGADLKEWMRGQPLPPREAATLMTAIADAAHHAHDKGVIHRDLKPSNVMISRDGQPHIMDFGLAKRDSGEITMTLDGATLGTPAYMSPEQAMGRSHDADARSDVYSLGVILYEMLTGERPFRGAKRMLIVQILEDDPPPIRRLNNQIAKDLETICLKCLRKEPERRFETASALAADLRRWLNGEPITARPVSRLEKTWLWCRKRPVSVGTAAALVFLSAVFSVVLLVQKQGNERRIAAQQERSDRERTVSLVDSLLSAPPDAVPYAIRSLEPLQSYAIPLLRQRFSDPEIEPSLRLHAALALAEFGQTEAEFLVSALGTAGVQESRNVIAALRSRKTSAAERLQFEFDQEQRPQSKASLAMALLQFGDVRACRSMLALQPDPVQRTAFIHGLKDRIVDEVEWADLLLGVEDSSFRSGLCLALGRLSTDDFSVQQREKLVPAVMILYQQAHDAATHSASGWALRQWSVELPKRKRVHVDDRPGWFVNELGMTMLRAPSGSFLRNNVYTLPKRPDQLVTLTRDFYLGDCEVTVGQFRQFFNDQDCPPAEKPDKWEFLEEHSPTDDCPATHISWFDAVLFCNWLSRRERLTPCYERTGEKQVYEEEFFSKETYVWDVWRLQPRAGGYRLPTEAEWEYASRAGTTTNFCFGDDEVMLPEYGWSGRYSNSRTWPVGGKLCNSWGFFDMHGNISEWCHDWYAAGWREDDVDPLGPQTYSSRAKRGGSFATLPGGCRSSSRSASVPHNRVGGGFRVACFLEPSKLPRAKPNAELGEQL